MNLTQNQSIVQNINETINQTVVSNSQVIGITIPFTNSPIFDIYIITFVVAIMITLINKYFTDQIKIKALRKEMKGMQKKLREEMKNNPKKAQELQKEVMKKNMETIKHSLNPKIMLLTAAPLIVVFSFIAKYYANFGQFLDLGFTTFGWLGTYIIFSIVNSLILKKVLDVA